ncbi:MAG: hypothetical protein MZU95_04940 [Desulfomicrobium escambiense]|nr:hypothetical protein [Desulfomicrobium escambiense]
MPGHGDSSDEASVLVENIVNILQIVNRSLPGLDEEMPLVVDEEAPIGGVAGRKIAYVGLDSEETPLFTNSLISLFVTSSGVCARLTLRMSFPFGA